MWGTNGASTENDLTARYNKGFAAALDLKSDGPLPIEQKAMHQAVGLNGQVQPVPGLTQMPDGSAVANPVGVVEWGRADAGRLWVVVVRTIGEASGTTRLIK